MTRRPRSKKPSATPAAETDDSFDPLRFAGEGAREQPQASLKAAPSISDWAAQVERSPEAGASRLRPQDAGDWRRHPDELPAAGEPDPEHRAEPTGKAAAPRGRRAAKSRKTAAERVKGGLNPVAGLGVAMEDLGALPESGVTATVQALERLIQDGRPEFRDKPWVPHRPPRPDKS